MQTIKDLIRYTIDVSLEINGVSEEDRENQVNVITKMIYINPLLRVVRDKSLHSFRPNYMDVAVKFGTHSPEEVELTQIMCEIHYLDYERLFSKGRKREVVDARAQLSSFLYTKLRYSFKRVGIFFNRDHSTIIHAINLHESLMTTNRDYSIKYVEFCDRVKKDIPHLLSDNKIIEEVFKDFKTERDIRRKRGNHSGCINTISKTRTTDVDIIRNSERVVDAITKSITESIYDAAK